MGIIRAFASATGGTLADIWIDSYTAGKFGELTVVAPGVSGEKNRGRGTNTRKSEGIITNGSKIFVPEFTAAFIFSQGAIENIITEPGEYEYQGGTGSVFNGDGFGTVVDQVKERVSYGGILPNQKQIAYINLKEIRGIKFGTVGPQPYHDMYYDADLEVQAYGTFSIEVVDPVVFVKKFVPANTNRYSFANRSARSQVVPEFTQSFMVAINSLSQNYRISQLPSQARQIAECVREDNDNVGSWPSRFGLRCVKVAIENIEFSAESREIVREFSNNRMRVNAYEGASQDAINAAAQQMIGEGIRNHGLGDGGGMILGMNVAQGITSSASEQSMSTSRSAQKADPMTLDEQINAVKRMKELLDEGILSQEEFEAKKKEIMNI